MIQKFVRVWLATAMMSLVVGTAAWAQGGTASSIIGTVTDASGAVIPGASVVVKSAATGAEYTATTNEQGGFTIPAVATGTYTVTVTLSRTEPPGPAHVSRYRVVAVGRTTS